MADPADFEDKKCLYADEWTRTYTAVGRSTGTPVLLRVYPNNPSRLRAFEDEIGWIRRTAPNGSPELIDVDSDGPWLTMVLRRPAGFVLSALEPATRFSPSVLLDLSHQLAVVLAAVHASRTMHRGLRPEIIFVDPESRIAQVVDFSRAALVVSDFESERSDNPPLMDPQVSRFVSPEQTGRMSRQPDTRSDLYALGACMYWMATAQAPFDSDDPLAIIHGHIARVPAPVLSLRPDLPPAISQIIDRLLQKAPDLRYPTAAALQRDLDRCRAEIAKSGTISSQFRLPSASTDHRLNLTDRIYDREHEQSLLTRAWEEAAAGGCCVVSLSGTSGSGKSALLQELRRQVRAAKGFVALCNCQRSRRDSLYSALAESLGGVVQQLLASGDAELDSWRSRLTSNLGNVANALTGVIPDIELLLPDLPAAPRLGPVQTFRRLTLATQRLVEALAAPGQALLIALDDIQWIDAGTGDLLIELLQHSTLRHVLFATTYTMNELSESRVSTNLVDALSSNERSNTTIDLPPLTRAASARMTADAFSQETEAPAWLVARIESQTGNNPRRLRELLEHLYDTGVLGFSEELGWMWTDAPGESATGDQGIEGLLAARIERSDPDRVRILEVAACLGASLDPDLLSLAVGDPTETIEARLFTLWDEGLLTRTTQGWSFAHERIRQAVLARLSDARRAETHEQLARLLTNTLDPTQALARAHEIADHLNCALSRIDTNERLWIVEVNERAGAHALEQGGASIAMRYLEVALDWLDEALFASQRDLGLRLYLNAVDAAFLTARYEKAEQLIGALEVSSWTPLERARIGVRRIRLLTLTESKLGGEGPAARVLRALRRYEINWPLRGSRLRLRFDVWRTDRLLRRVLDADLLHHTRESPNAWLPKLLLTSAATPVIQVESGLWACRVPAYAIRCYVKHGYVGSPALSIAAYAAYRRFVAGDLREMARLGKAALRFASSSSDPISRHRTRFLVSAFVEAWTGPRRPIIDVLADVCEALREVGDLEFALFAACQRANYVALAGTPLPSVARELRDISRRSGRSAAPAYEVFAQACDLLTGEYPENDAITRQAEAVAKVGSTHPSTRMSCWAFWQIILLVLGKHQEAFSAARDIASWCFDSGASSSSQLADYLFARGISAASAHEDATCGLSSRERREAERMLRESARRLRIWARDAPDFRHMSLAMEAERAAARGRSGRCIDLLLRAIELATQTGYVHHAAILRERLADVLVRLGRTAEASVERELAAARYAEWGAVAKAQMLRSLADTTGTHGAGQKAGRAPGARRR